MRMDRLGVAPVLVLVSLISAWVAVAAIPDGEQTGRDRKAQQRDSAVLRAAVDDAGVELLSVEEEGEAAEVLAVQTCDRIGDDSNRADNTNIYRGNIYSVEHDNTVLTEIKMELAFTGELILRFTIRGALSDAVPQVFSKANGRNDIEVTVQGDGTNTLYSTGPIHVPLEKGFDYAIGASWGSAASSVSYFNDSQRYPLPYTHGRTLKRVLLNASPLPDDQVFTISTTSGAYSMELCFEPVMGACCASTHVPPAPATQEGLCHQSFKNDCLALEDGAFFHGDRTTCADTVCRYGACCDPCGTCQVDPFTEESCTAIDGTFQLNAVCPPTGQEELCPKATGACCDADGGCDDTTCEQECIQRGDTYLGDETTCQPNMCAGACCIPDTFLACRTTSRSNCTAFNGGFRGEGTTCETLPAGNQCTGACCFGLPGDLDDCEEDVVRSLCTPIEDGERVYRGDATSCPGVTETCGELSTFGGCCHNDGTCINTTSVYCAKSWVKGDFHGDGVKCGPESPPCETAACCFRDGSCKLLTEIGCTNLGGDIWHPNILLCELDTCEGSIPTGACCDVGAGACEPDVTQRDCEDRGDLFRGEGTTCDDDPLFCASLGACCRENGECFDAVTTEQCDILGGTFQLTGSTCADPDLVCNLRGACCTDTAGCLLTTEDECNDLTTEPSTNDPNPFLGIGTVCLEDTCPSGACCLSTDDGTCVMRREDLCRDFGEFYQGPQTTCEAGLCTLGACCEGGACTARRPASECTTIGSEFSPRAVCNNNACEPGACCIDGDCLFETRAFCDSAEGFYQGPNHPCGGGICDLGRCCMEGGVDPLCDVVGAQCSAASTIPFDAGVACGSPLPCEQRGACCPALGECRDGVLTSDCDQPGELFTPNALCGLGGVVCPVRGACCSEGACEEVTIEECDARSGVYLGDGNTCFIGLCTLGSCCVGGGFSCEENLIASECMGQADIFRAVLDCTVGCDLAGACCLTEGVCVDNVLQSVCAQHGGAPSPGASCVNVACLARGACCGPTGTCSFGTVGECNSIQGEYLGDGTACGAGSCPTGACCNDGQCDELTEAACSEVLGLYDGDSTTCSSERCDVGACCHLDGTCLDSSLRLQCGGALDEFRRFEACADFCTPRGACCINGQGCQDRKTQSQCTNDGGSFGGAGSVCEADTCDTGGCCLDVGICREDLARFGCLEQEGTFLGVGVLCGLLEACATGACCQPNGFCQADILSVDCAAPNNRFNAGSTCEVAACEAFGACCLDDLSCQQLTLSECLDAGGRFSTTNAVCEPDDFCLPGACCLPNGSCDSLSRRVCDNANGIYQGAGVVCGDVECAGGSCCQLNGTCDENLLQSECLDGNGTFDVGVDCSTTICVPRGACCGLNGCTLESRAECLVSGSTFIGNGIACGADTCSGINNSDPANCSIDARQPTEPDGSGVYGWDKVELVFDFAAGEITPAGFTVSLLPGPGTPPTITEVVAFGLSARLTFDTPIPPGQWTCITHDDSGAQVCLGYAPGDADGDGEVEAADIVTLVDCISGVTTCDLWQCDLDQSGRCGAADLLRGIDLLGGAEQFDEWLDQSIGVCPSLAP